MDNYLGYNFPQSTAQAVAAPVMTTDAPSVLASGSVNIAGFQVTKWFVGIAVVLAGIRVLAQMGAKVD